MCIAIVTKPGATISEDTINRCFLQNRDGGGFAYIKEGKVMVEKGFMTATAMKDKYALLLEAKANDGPMLIHFRIATTGKVGRDNCHPFIVGRGVGNGAMIHNGSIYSGPNDAEKSDTRVLAERQRNNFTYEVVKEAVEDFGKELGSWNKIAFLFPNGEFVIVNENQGQWHDDVWFSNHHFKPWKPQYSSGSNTSRPGSSCGIRDV